MKYIYLLIAFSITQVLGSQQTLEEIMQFFFPEIKKNFQDVRPKDEKVFKNIRFLIGDLTEDKFYYYFINPDYLRVTISNCFVNFVVDIYDFAGNCIKNNYVIILKDFQFYSYVEFIKDPGITTRYSPLFTSYYCDIDVKIDNEQFDNNIPNADYIKDHIDILKYGVLSVLNLKWRDYLKDIILNMYLHGVIKE